MFGWKKKGAVAEKEKPAPKSEPVSDGLKVKIKDRQACLVTMAVEVPADQVKKATEDSFRRVQAKVKLPGFRPGKAPMELIQKNFSEAAWEDATDHLLRESVYKAIMQE